MNFIKTIVEKLLGSETNTYQQKERSFFIAFLFGFIYLVPNTITMVLANSMTLQSNLLRSGSETLAIFFSWLTVRRIARGKSFNYNYGYGKLENLSSLVIAAVMLISLVIIFYNALARFRNPVAIGDLGAGMGILFVGLSGSANAWFWVHNQRLARKEHSPIVESQWRLFRVKTIANLCVILSLGLSLTLRGYSWTIYIDPIGSLILSGFLLFSAYSIATMSVYDLLDRTLEESLQLIILQQLATYFHEYVALHGIQSRRSGSNVYIEIFLEFDGNKEMAKVQKIIDSIRTDLEQKIQGSQVVIAPVTSPMV